MTTAAGCSSSSTTSIGPSPNKCSIGLVTPATSLAGSGGTGTVSVTAAPECAWNASAEANWISGLSPVSGQGTGQIGFAVPANPAAAARLAEIVVNDARIQVRQEASACRFEIVIRSQSFDAAGGASTATVGASADGCSWSAKSGADWIVITSGDNGTASGTIGFLVRANSGADRSGSLTIAGQAFTVRQTAAGVSCAYAINPATQAIGAAGGAGPPVAVSTAAGCAWTPAAGVPWITITAGASGSGNGSFSFSVTANSGPARSGAVTVAGQTFTVTQAAVSCSYTINPNSQSIDASGGTGMAAVSAAGGCAWTAASEAGWITVTAGATSSGNGTIRFSVAGNGGAPRTGTLKIAGQTLTITQAGTCSYSITPTSQSMEDVGGVGVTIAVSAGAGCAWTSVSNAPWISVISGASGSGNGSVKFSVLPNTDKKDKKRDGTLTIAGRTFSVSQSNK